MQAVLVSFLRINSKPKSSSFELTFRAERLQHNCQLHKELIDRSLAQVFDGDHEFQDLYEHADLLVDRKRKFYFCKVKFT